MPWTPRIISLLFGLILLFPLALIFINMLRYKPTSDEEMAKLRIEFEDAAEKETDLRPTNSGEPYGAVSTVDWVEESVSPFPFAANTIFYTPRKWIGTIGLSAVIVLIFCLAISTLVPRKMLIGSDFWELRSEESPPVESTPEAANELSESGSIIRWDESKEE